MAKKPKPKPEPNAQAEASSLAVEVGRIAKLFALHVLKDVEDESEKVLRLKGAGFSTSEIAAMLGKTENNVRVTISLAKKKRNG